jgi:hypothetical protein
MVDFKPGDILFTRNMDNTVSGIIATVQDALDDAGFDPSHVLIIQDDKWGIESAENGVRWCRLHPIWHENFQYIIARPYSKYDETVTGTRIVKEALKYYGRPYDYTGLVAGFPMMLITKLSRLIKPLRKLPIPLHLPGSFVCSAFASQAMKDTRLFDEVKLLQEWHTTRITPSMLLREFPWRYMYEYSSIHPVVSTINRSPDGAKTVTANTVDAEHDAVAVNDDDDAEGRG